MDSFRQWLKISLIILVLTGIQIVQASPLHDHLDHVAGCLLCHYDNCNHALPIVNSFGPVEKSHYPVQVSSCQVVTTTNPSSFQSRAPPVSFL